MPPPPPPSKSYLINITDSDLESEEEEEQDDGWDANRSDPALSTMSPRSSVAGSADDFFEDDGDEEADDDDNNDEEEERSPCSSSSYSSKNDMNASQASRSKKKRKKKKKKKKKKSNSSATASATAASAKTSTAQKHVSFGDIRIREFARSFYSDGVPQDGGWPLGFSTTDFTDGTEPLTVAEYEQAKQARLAARWETLRPDEALPTAPLETRQWDFKFGIKNPLFRALSEKRRMQLIMGIEEQQQQPPPSSPSSSAKQGAAAAASSPASRRMRSNADAGQRNKSRSGSFSENHHHSHHHSRRHSAARSSSRTEDKDADFEARHVQQELEQLRTERTKQGSRGCTCRKLHVYIPPPNAGKKAAHRRMNVNKVKEELRKRNALPSPQGSREDLERLLLDLVQQEPCCGPECECTMNGVECQSDVCSCWKASNNHLKESTQAPSPAEIEARCGNTFGMYAYDESKIDDYRRPFITCQPVGGGNGGGGSGGTKIAAQDSTREEEKKMEIGS